MGGRLDGKVVVLIGAGQSPGESVGNGRAVALQMMREGAHVLAVDKDFASAQETVSMAGDAGNGSLALEADVRDAEGLRRAMDKAVECWGRLDVLLYNVGVSIGAGDAPLEDFTEDVFDRINSINLRGAIMAAKHAIAHMRKQGSGVIVNIASVSAVETNRTTVAYGPSKAAMVSFTQWLAVQNAAHGIRANAILPGIIDTPMSVDLRARTQGVQRSAIEQQRVKRVPLGRQGTGWDVAHAAVFLASDEASFITGVSLPVDGGMLARIGF